MASNPNTQGTVTLVEMLSAVGHAIMVDAGLAAQLVTGQFVVPVANDLAQWARNIGKLNLGKDIPSLTDLKGLAGAPFVDSYFEAGMDINPYPKDADYAQAIDLLRQLVSFSLIFPMVMSGVSLVGKLPLANRWSDQITELVGKIPEEMGISWALGGILQTIFDQVAGQKIEEYINVTKTPSRPDQGLILRLLRQHKVSHADYSHLMTLIGYDNYYQSLFQGVDQQQLPITDIQALYLNGTLDDNHVKAYLTNMGFSNQPQTIKVFTSDTDANGKTYTLDSDVNYLFQLYFDKAETEAGATYKSYAKTAYLEDRITNTEFVAILSSINVPQKVITLELAALDFEKAHGRANLSLSTLKKEYVSGIKDTPSVEQELSRMGYTYADAQRTIASWDKATVTRKAGLSAAKILAYKLGGILSRDQAINKLESLGYSLEDAAFLADHPETKSNSGGIPYTEDNIQTAFIDKLLSPSDAMHLLEQIGHDSVYAGDLVSIWDYNAKHVNASNNGYKPLSVDQIHTAWNTNSISDAETISLLEQDGYAITDAEIIWASWYRTKHGVPQIAPVPA